MSLSADFLDELRSRVGLQSVVGRRVKLSRAGREWKGCCPFHNEKTPSFYVNEDKGFYHCFGCGAHGDAIRFLMEVDGLPFMEAVRALAAEAGVEVPESRPRDAKAEQRASLRDLVAAAAEWFEEQLRASGGAAARAVLEDRQVPMALAARFGLGFAPDSRDALSRALKARFPDVTPAELLEAGLAGESEGRRYDRFRGRLMFPIHDGRGRAVGFGGRALGDVQPKYLNSAEGPLFDKGRLLYNLHRAQGPARKSDRLLIVEGYMDVIGLARVDIAEAVAPLGTALTEAQMALAWRLVDVPLLAFDGDAAGVRAGHRAAVRALTVLAPGKSLGFIGLPPGQDPDDLARAGGRAAVEAAIGRAVPLDRFIFEAEVEASAPLDTPERRAALRARLEALAATIPHEGLARDYKHTFLGRLRDMQRPARPVRQAPTRGRRDRNFTEPLPPLRPETRAAVGQKSEQVLAALLASIAARPGAAARHAELLAEMNPQRTDLKELRDGLLAAALDGEPMPKIPRGTRPLLPADITDAEFDSRIGRALASLAELHHIDAEMQPRMWSSDQGFAVESERLNQLRLARDVAMRRLASLVIGDDAANGAADD